MTESASHTTPFKSVVFADGDYVGLFRRFVIILVDGALVWFALIPLTWLWYDVIDRVGDPYDQLLWSWIGFCYVYLAILTPSRIRSVGLWVTGARIVDHKGHPSSVIRMTFRSFLWLLGGPFNPVIDLLWLGSDQHRQTLRDKCAGTYVVNRRAAPVGHGKRTSAYYNFMGVLLIFWEVRSAE